MREPTERAARTLALAVALAAPLLAGGQTYNLPDFGSTADTVLSAGDERRLGRAFMQSVQKALKVVDEPVLTDYIEGLGGRLAAASDDATRRFSFFLIDEPVVNAFAGPDGHIGVYAGLILETQSEAELAAVLAHEIAHVTQRHLLRSVEDRQRMSGPAAALLIAAAILGAQVGGDAGMAAVAGVQAATLQHQINFTRDNEKEADRVGIGILAAADFDPYAMPGFFERLSRASRLYEDSAPEFLRTHPVSTNRIADSLGRADGFGHRQRPDDLRYHLARANLRQRGYTRPEAAIEHFRATLASGRHRNEVAERYGLALALTRAGQLAAAKREMEGLIKQHPQQVELLVLDAQIDQRQGAAAGAANRLRPAVGLRPGNVPLRLAYAEALIGAGKVAEAQKTLEDLLRRTTPTVLLYQHLELAARRAGAQAASHFYRGEHLYLQGELKPAIHQLELALRVRGVEFLLASRIQERLEVLKREWEELDEDERKDKERGERRNAAGVQGRAGTPTAFGRLP